MVAEPWPFKMGNQVSGNFNNGLPVENLKKSSYSFKKQTNGEKQVIGIISFEVANLMSKIIYLHKSLSDSEINKLKNEILRSEGILSLVSEDETKLLELVLLEKLDDLNRVSGVVARLGKKCSIPPLQGFEHVYGDIVSGVIDVNGLTFLVKDMDSRVKKMERYVNSTAKLYGEMVVMNQLEITINKFQQNHHEECQKAFEQKLVWQKQDVRHLKDVSLWNLSYDKVVELLVRTVCTIYARILVIFGGSVPCWRKSFGGDVSQSRLEFTGTLDHKKQEFVQDSGILDWKFQTGNDFTRLGHSKNFNRHRPHVGMQRTEGGLFGPEDFNFTCGIGPGKLFMECLMLSGSNSLLDDDDHTANYDTNSQISGCCSVTTSTRKRDQPVTNSVRFSPKNAITIKAPPTTVGGSALALRYANVIIIIEKLLHYPHLIGDEARDDLYQMLPMSLKKLLRNSLKACLKDLAIYDAPLAHDWKEKLDGILSWLAPMANNMIKWQNERNFEQQRIGTRTHVLLLETLYFADRVKTEVSICQLLVGLTYICRYEQQQNALLDCSSSFDIED